MFTLCLRVRRLQCVPEYLDRKFGSVRLKFRVELITWSSTVARYDGGRPLLFDNRDRVSSEPTMVAEEPIGPFFLRQGFPKTHNHYKLLRQT